MSQNVSNYQKMYEELLLKKQGVFAVEYRGYRTNKKNKVSESKLRKDVELAYNYLTETKGIKPQNITVIGHSMGGALATNFASKHPEIKSLILLCPIVKPSFLGQKFTTNKNLGIGMPNSIKNITDKFKPLKWLLDFRFNSMAASTRRSVLLCPFSWDHLSQFFMLLSLDSSWQVLQVCDSPAQGLGVLFIKGRKKI